MAQAPDIDAEVMATLSVMAARLKQAYGEHEQVPAGQTLLAALLGAVAGCTMARNVLLQSMDFSDPTLSGAFKGCQQYQPQSLDLLYLKAGLPHPSYGIHANLYTYHLDQLALLERKLSAVLETAIQNIDGPSEPAEAKNQFHL